MRNFLPEMLVRPSLREGALARLHKITVLCQIQPRRTLCCCLHSLVRRRRRLRHRRLVLLFRTRNRLLKLLTVHHPLLGGAWLWRRGESLASVITRTVGPASVALLISVVNRVINSAPLTRGRATEYARPVTRGAARVDGHVRITHSPRHLVQ